MASICSSGNALAAGREAVEAAAVQAAVRTVSPDDRADGGRIIVQLDKD